jgi:hypothetical protein
MSYHLAMLSFQVTEKILKYSQTWWYTPVIPPSWEVKIGKTEFQGQLRQKCKTLSEK